MIEPLFVNLFAMAPEQIDFSLHGAFDRVNGWVQGGIRLLPNFIVALVVWGIFYGAGVLLRRFIIRQSTRRQRDNLGVVFGGFVKATFGVLGFLFAATIVLPSLKPGDLISGLGVSSVAIGFAFKDILQNWLAGLLILLRQPFEVNDQIEVTGHEGTVERIETRATIIRTYDGQRVVIPNSEIYSNAILVKTAHEFRRIQYDVGIGYGDGIEHACEVLRVALAGVPGVDKDPAPEALPWDLAASWVTIRVRWWTHSRRIDVVQSQAAVILAMKLALDKARIDLPFETQVHLFHDQTETLDGERGRQREGWPAPQKERTKSRWTAQQEERTQSRGTGSKTADHDSVDALLPATPAPDA